MLIGARNPIWCRIHGIKAFAEPEEDVPMAIICPTSPCPDDDDDGVGELMEMEVGTGHDDLVSKRALQ